MDLITALVTPFQLDGTLDLPGFNDLLKLQVKAGIKAVLIAGTTGENPVLTLEEVRALVQVSLNYPLDIWVNCGSNNPVYSLKLYDAVKDLDIKGVMLINPYYNKTDEAGLLAHFTFLLTTITHPVLLYNVPSRTGQFISIKVISTLVETFNHIAGIKEASNDLDYLLALKAACPNLPIYAGNDLTALVYRACGAKGLISVASNIIPAALARWLQGDKLDPLYAFLKALSEPLNPCGIKALMAANGLINPTHRLPLVPLSAERLAPLQARYEEVLGWLD